MSKNMGALVMYCSHKGYFVADLWRVAGAVVVRANGPIDPGNIIRDGRLGPPTHRLTDFPKAGFWKPSLGVFVVPENQVIELP